MRFESIVFGFVRRFHPLHVIFWQEQMRAGNDSVADVERLTSTRLAHKRQSGVTSSVRNSQLRCFRRRHGQVFGGGVTVVAWTAVEGVWAADQDGGFCGEHVRGRAKLLRKSWFLAEQDRATSKILRLLFLIYVVPEVQQCSFNSGIKFYYRVRIFFKNTSRKHELLGQYKNLFSISQS